MAPVGSAGLQRLDYVTAMLLAAVFSSETRRLLRQPVREIVLEPLAPFGTAAQVAASLSVDPVREIDPPGDLFRALPVPGKVFAQVAVLFGAVVSEPAQYVDPHL